MLWVPRKMCVRHLGSVARCTVPHRSRMLPNHIVQPHCARSKCRCCCWPAGMHRRCRQLSTALGWTTRCGGRPGSSQVPCSWLRTCDWFLCEGGLLGCGNRLRRQAWKLTGGASCSLLVACPTCPVHAESGANVRSCCRCRRYWPSIPRLLPASLQGWSMVSTQRSGPHQPTRTCKAMAIGGTTPPAWTLAKQPARRRCSG